MKIIEIKEDVKIVQEDFNVILEKGDRIRVLKENVFGIQDFEKIMPGSHVNFESAVVKVVFNGKKDEFRLVNPTIFSRKTFFEIDGYDSLSRKSVVFSINKRGLTISQKGNAFKFEGVHSYIYGDEYIGFVLKAGENTKISSTYLTMQSYSKDWF